MEELDKSSIKLFKRKFDKEKRLFVRKSIKLQDESAMGAFARSIIYQYPQDVAKTIKALDLDLATVDRLKKVYEFMKAHDDRLPSMNVPEEVPLCNIINQAIADGAFTDKILRFNIIKTNAEGISSTQEILKELIDNVEKNSLLKQTFLQLQIRGI